MTLSEALHKISQQEQIIAELKQRLDYLTEKSNYRERFFVNTFKGEKIIEVSEVRYFVSENKSTYIVLHNGNSFVIDMPLTDIVAQLDPHLFMRVNRKYIVPASLIAGFERDINGKEKLLLKSGKKNPDIIISRDNKHVVHEWLSGVHSQH